MIQGKLDMHGDRIRKENEIDKIAENLRNYLSLADISYIKDYIDNWEMISKQKGYIEESLLDVLNASISHQEKYLIALAIDIWDVFHPLSLEDAKRHNIMMRKKVSHIILG